MLKLLRIKVARSEYGYALLENGSIILIRPVIANVLEAEPRYSTGPQFVSQHSVIVSVISPRDLKEKVKDKPVPVDENF